MNYQDEYDPRRDVNNSNGDVHSGAYGRDPYRESRARTFSQETGPSSPTRPSAVHASSSTSTTTSGLSVSQSLLGSTSNPGSSSGTTHSPLHAPAGSGAGGDYPGSQPYNSDGITPTHGSAGPGVGPGMGNPHHAQSMGITHRPSLGDLNRLSSGMDSFANMRLDGAGGQGAGQGEKGDAVPVAFDEGVLRGLCEMDGALPLLVDRIKQSIASCKQVAVFFRSRAEIEEKCARSMIELFRTTSDVYARADCKAGSFVNAYQASLKVQDQVAHNRIRFSQRLNEMSDELLGLAREGERMRKLHKENGMRYQGILQESEVVMEKAKARFDATAEELERLLVAKEGESFKDAGMRSSASTSSNGTSGSGSNTALSAGGGKRALGKAMTKGGLLFKGKGAAAIQRQEDDVRTRMTQSSETFRKAVLESQALRQEYFNFQLPKILRLLKECADELDLGTQYHLTRFAFLYESTIVGDGTIVNPLGAPDEGPGLKTIFETIDNRTDFKSYMQNYAVARQHRGPRRDGPYEEGFLPPLPPHVQKSADAAEAATRSPQQPHVSQIPINGSIIPPPPGSTAGPGIGSGPSQSPEQYAVPGIPAAGGATFGVDLTEQLARDGLEIPKVVLKCAETIEAYGIESMGIYRLSGTTSKVQALKKALDTDIDNTDVMSEEWSADINVVSGALKLWFRELPEPLLTYGLYNAFIEAARYENDRLRHIRLHEQVNELPDPNYATLKFFMGHLDRIRRRDSVNQMSVSNLSIVFGPTLLGAPPEEGGLNLEHMSFQCKAIETILEKFNEIFVEEEAEAAVVNPADDQSGPGADGLVSS